MSKNSAIEIYLRVRPTKNKHNGLKIDEENNKCNMFIPKDGKQGYINNTQEHYSFEFQKVFNMQTSQEQIFKDISKDVCDSALEGFNGTIFAYGQTGSGKTYTMTGGSEHYDDRGVIPRTISYLFQQSRERSDILINLSISYIEIYGNSGYDLLDENHTTKKLEDLPKVIPRETENEEIILSGLSVHKASNEDDALGLLFIGDTNRVVCETPKNDASTRSHCIFIIMIESRQPNSDVKTLSRIHLVDLSGSERIGQTGVQGKLQEEARGINLSLHYLEHVIVCLNKRANGENIHIPYRNSLMTLVLRDSLGGNCKTKMIAAISPEEEDQYESISTCKFAQRVALIKNYVVKNESVDPAIIIDRLKRENAQLKAEIAMLKGENVKDSLQAEEIEECRKQVLEFIDIKDPSYAMVLNDRLKINQCFYHFKHIYNDLLRKFEKGGGVQQIQAKSQEINSQKENQNQNQQNNNNQDNYQFIEEIKRLKLLIQQRDNEIFILLNLVNKNKNLPEQQQIVIPVSQSENETGTNHMLYSSNMRESKPITFHQFDLEKQQMQQQQQAQQEKPQNLMQMKEMINQQQELAKQKQNSLSTNPNNNRIGSDVPTQFTASKPQSLDYNNGQNDISLLSNSKNQNNQQIINNLKEVQNMLLFPINLTNEQLMDRANTFDLFRKSYRKNEIMEENKQLLKDKYNKARELGNIVNMSRARITDLKNQIESIRKEQAISGLIDGVEDKKHPDEEKYSQEIEKQKRIYKENFDELKEMKCEIERIQKLLERNKDKMQKDFERWLDVMMNQRTQMMQMANTNTNLQNNFSSTSQQMNNESNLSQKMQGDIQKISDKKANKQLQDFFKQRDEIINKQ